MTPEKERSIRAKIIEDGGCWRWDTAAKTKHNRKHPAVMVDGKMKLVRRVVYEMERGPLRPTIFLVPSCGDECCIHPEHMRQLTKAQKNMLGSKAAAGSPSRGAKVSAAARRTRAKLTEESAREIRMSDESLPVLARRYGVDEKAIWDVRQGNTWRDYRNPLAGLLL